MGVEYDDCPILAEQKDKAAERAKGKKPAPAKDKNTIKAKGERLVARKCKASEPGDVRLGHELVKPSKKSQKCTHGGWNRDIDAANAERAHEGLGESFPYVLILVAYSDGFLRLPFFCFLKYILPYHISHYLLFFHGSSTSR